MKIDVNRWMVPNFVTLKMPPGKRQDGFKQAPSLPLSDVDADTLSDLCDAFREEIFKKSGKADPRGAR